MHMQEGMWSNIHCTPAKDEFCVAEAVADNIELTGQYGPPSTGTIYLSSAMPNGIATQHK